VPTPPEPVDLPPDTEPVDPFADGAADATALGVLETLAIEHVTLTIPSTVIDPEQPAEPLLMLDFRDALLRGSTPLEAKDRAWRHLCRLARTERGEWNLYALGVAFPRLRADANRLHGGRSWDAWQQIHFNLAVAFLFGVHRNQKLDDPSVFRRLADNAYDQVSGRRTPTRRNKSRRPPDAPLDVLAPILLPKEHPHTEYGNPEREALANLRSVIHVFEELIATINAAPDRQRITPAQAMLLRRTYLDRAKLRDVAAELKLSEPSASKQRTRAENTIARFLGRPDLAQPVMPAAGQPAGPPRVPRQRTDADTTHTRQRESEPRSDEAQSE
jgi:hypothetical protein